MPKMPTVKTYPVWIGIDPGKNGGIVAIYKRGDILYTVMPDTERGVWEWLFWIAHNSDVEMPVMAVIEKVSGFVGKNQPGSRMFNFGMGYGGLRMALIGNGIPFDEVTPQKWQKEMGCLTGGDKLVSLRKAQQLYPKLPLWKEPRSLGKQKAIADALLIATYAMRKDQGKL